MRVNMFSGPLKRILAGEGVDPDKIVVMPNGVDLAAFGEVRDATALRQRLDLQQSTVIGFVGYVLVVAFSYSGIFSFISGSSFVLIEQLHLTPAQYGASFGAVVLGFMLGTFLAGRLTPRLGGAWMIRIGTLLSLGGGLAGAALALAGVLHLLAIVIPVFLFILGAGMTLPNATANAVGMNATDMNATTTNTGVTDVNATTNQ